VDVAPAIVEEDEPHSAPGSPRVGALHLSSLDGDATPGRRRSPSPPPQLGESAFDDDAYSDSPVSTTSRMSGENGEQHERERDDDDHIRDDADAEHDSHRASSTAALGFEIRNYNKRPTWGRRGSGSGSRPSSLLAAEPPE
jgi:hypothetical protein